MQPELINQYITERYQNQVDWYDRKAVWNRWWFSRMQWVIIGFSAVTPVLLSTGNGFAQKVAVVTSLVVTVLAAGLKAFRFEELWLNYRTTCEALRTQYHLFQAGVGAYANPETRFARFVETVEAMLSRENTLWLSSVRSNREREDATETADGKPDDAEAREEIREAEGAADSQADADADSEDESVLAGAGAGTENGK